MEAQYSNVSAIIYGDWNKDGNTDIILAGNDGYQRVKFGKMDANKGQVFLGNGDGTFQYLSQSKSNLNISGDTRNIHSLQNGALIFLRNNDFPLIYEENR